MSYTPHQIRLFESARLPFTLGLLVIAGCDKLAPKENVTPLPRVSAPGAVVVDAGSGGGFTPTVDASVVVVAPDGAVVPDDEVDGSVVVVERTCSPLPEARAFSKTALLESVSECVTHYYCEFDVLAQKFADRAEAYAAAPGDATRSSVRNAWYTAARAWEVTELFEFGPAAPSMEPGGAGLRDEIDSFPLVSRCTIEESLTDETYATAGFGTSASNGRGISAVEYALFYEGTDNACSSFSRINSRGTWAALSAGDLSVRRSQFVGAAARVIAERAGTLLAAWSPADGDFSRTLASAGHGSSVYATEQSALNAVSNALFFIDKELKDSKVARPGGLMDCAANCGALAESPYARVGKDFIADNLRGFRLIFQGCGADNTGLGFDDWLRAAGRSDLADDMLAALDGAERALAGIDRIEDAFVNDPAKVAALHAAIKVLTDLIKMDFVSALNLDRPMSSEGDND